MLHMFVILLCQDVEAKKETIQSHSGNTGLFINESYTLFSALKIRVIIVFIKINNLGAI